MINFLNSMTFKKFGAILLTPIDANDNQKEDRIYKSCDELVCFTNSSVYLERLDDMCVIVLSIDDTLQRFYFDKPVVINPGVWFCVLILGENGCYRRVTDVDSEFISRKFPKALVKPLFESFLKVENIYTMFHQEQNLWGCNEIILYCANYAIIISHRGTELTE